MLLRRFIKKDIICKKNCINNWKKFPLLPLPLPEGVGVEVGVPADGETLGTQPAPRHPEDGTPEEGAVATVGVGVGVSWQEIGSQPLPNVS